MEEYITRTEFERQITQLREEMKQRQTDAMQALRAELDPGSIHHRLDNHAVLMKEISTKQDEQEQTLTLIYSDVGHMKTDIGTIKTTLENTATKEDVKAMERRFDAIADIQKQILDRLPAKGE